MLKSISIYCAALMAICSSSIVNVAAQERPMNHKTLEAAVTFRMSDSEGKMLANQVKTWFGNSDISRGSIPKVAGLDVAWAIETEEGHHSVEVSSENGKYQFPLVRLTGTNVYAASSTLASGAGMKWRYLVDGRTMSVGNLEVYSPDPVTVENPNVPKGKLTQMPRWKSKIFADTERDWWVYVPEQYDASKPACVMIFQDGGGPKSYIPTVFDNMISKGEIPVTVGIFINPGTLPGNKSNRSFEYDTLSDQYARFLLDEILPEVEKSAKLRHDAAGRAISGASSGGICAFTVAYERPNEFHKVLSWVGSFTNIQHGENFKMGGHNYAGMVRKGPVKPIRVFLQDGENDLDNDNGSWPLANQTLAGSFKFRGWDYRFAYGQGFHSDRHGRAILGDSLRWLWRN